MGKAWVGVFVGCLFTVSLPAAETLPPPAKIRTDFTRDIQPIFRTNCYGCHGAALQSSGLRMDRKADALRGGYSGPVIVPGDSGNSKLIRLVAGFESKVVMPPAGPRMTAEQIGLLRAWIDQGAPWPEDKTAAAAPVPDQKPKSTHWAFQKPVRAEPPAIQNRAWVRNSIDAFVLAKQESLNIAPSPEADKLTLLRRVSFDLTGLPPAPAEMTAFLQDNREDAYEQLVERLLQSPHFGEKWARQWLDLARYADSDGYEKDTARPHAWRWRHWVIDALNRDMPFDRFTIEQIAGDQLPDGTLDQKIATGFHRNTLTNREGGTNPEEFRIEQVIDRTHTVSSVWLGLTAGCARCHDHKYDPISQKEFYQMFAFFNTAEEVNIEAPLPGEMGPYLAAKPEYERRRRELLEEYRVPELQAEWETLMREAAGNPGKFPDRDFSLNALRVLIDRGQEILLMDARQRKPDQQRTLTGYFIRSFRHIISKERQEEIRFEQLQEQLRELDAKLPPISMAPVLARNPDDPKTHILVRGDWQDKGIEVQPGTPAVLHPLKDKQPTRLSLARWLVSPENPLTARVTVNRIWQELFGRGLVRTSEDFGTMGEKPSHPELLDWLAVEFRERGWSMKSMIRLMVTSATYRQSSNARPELESSDPGNTLLARQNRLRLPAELLRDAALRAAGLLDTRIGGRSIRPPQPEGVAELAYNNAVKWVESEGPDRYRRGLYVHFQRTTPYPQLMNFDAPDASLTCSRRQRSNTPLQALNLLNDQVFFEAAQALAYRVLTEVQGGFRERFNYACQLAIGRGPGPRELERMAKYFDGEISAYKKADSARELFPHMVDGIDAAQGAAWLGVSRVLLNLDEFMTRE